MRIAEQRVGAHLRFRDLDRDSLRAAVGTALSPEVPARAAVLGSRLRSAQGAAALAAEAVEGALEGGRRVS